MVDLDDIPQVARLAISDDRRERALVYPILDRVADFNHAAIAPLPAPTVVAMKGQLDQVMNSGSAPWKEWIGAMSATRRSIARFAGVAETSVACVKNTTEGLSIVAEGFDWRPGDSVVVVGSDFPANVFPWLDLERRGVVVRRFEREFAETPTADRLLDLVDHSTRIVALSLVDYADGVRFPVEEVAAGLADRPDCHLVVDAIQGLGAVPLDSTGIDAITADGHKWLMGPEGAGFLALSERLNGRLRTHQPSWTNVKHPPGQFQTESLDPVAGARRHEGGTLNTVGLIGLGRSVDLLGQIGIEVVWSRLRSLIELLVERLRAAGREVVAPREAVGSGILVVKPASRRAVEVARELARLDVNVSPRQGYVRIAPHHYQDEIEIDALLRGLERVDPL